MTFIRIAILTSFLAILSFSGPSPQVFFSPNGGSRSQIVGLIQRTTQNIDVAIYSFTSKEIGLALAGAAQSGRKIRVIADRDQNKGKSSVIPWLSKYMEVRILPEPGVRGMMHHKFMLIGNHVMTSGSYNWSNNAEYFNRENLLVFSDPELMRQYHQEFEKLWEKAKPFKRVEIDQD